MTKKIKTGIIGLGCRGFSLLDTILACENAEIAAVCDVYPDRIDRAFEKICKKQKKQPAKYADYRELLADGEIEAVLICSSWDEHIRMAIQSMRAGKITAMEVGGAYDVEECWELVRTYEETKTPIMLMENCCFDRFELLATSLVRAGKLGEIVHCHGAYSHDLRDEVLGGYVNRHYRLDNYKKRNCENYPTHELGPIAKLLDINRGNRMISLVSVASKSAGLEAFSQTEKNPDASLRGVKFAQGDIVNTIITCANGETISLKLDTTLPKYYSREFTVRGTKGLCNQEANMVMLEGESNFHEFFEPEKTLERQLNSAQKYNSYLPSEWRDITAEEKALGHGGMDYFMFKEFFNCIEEKREFPIDVYDAASWMCITALSEQSVATGGAVRFIPDFTRGKWRKRPRKGVVSFPDEK